VTVSDVTPAGTSKLANRLQIFSEPETLPLALAMSVNAPWFVVGTAMPELSAPDQYAMSVRPGVTVIGFGPETSVAGFATLTFLRQNCFRVTVGATFATS
jgi:hypothetical protein